MSLTFNNFKISSAPSGGQVLVKADCVENGKEAYALVSKGGDVFARAAEKLARLS